MAACRALRQAILARDSGRREPVETKQRRSNFFAGFAARPGGRSKKKSGPFDGGLERAAQYFLRRMVAGGCCSSSAGQGSVVRETDSDADQTRTQTRTSERNRKPVRQRRRSLRSNRYRSTCCDGRGCGSCSAGSRGNRGPASDGSTCRSRCRKPERNRTRVRRRTTVRKRERHKPERHKRRSVRRRRRSLHSTWGRSNCRPSCDQANRLGRSNHRRKWRRRPKRTNTTSWGGLLFLLGNEH